LAPASLDDRLASIALVGTVVGLLVTALLAAYALAVNVRAARVQALVNEQTAGLTKANHELELEISQRRLPKHTCARARRAIARSSNRHRTAS